MSALTYIASNKPLREIKNPHIRFRSIRQALAEGAKLPNWMTMEMLEGKDWDKPDSVLYFTDAYTGEEFAISPFDKNCYWDDIYTKKEFCAHVDWHNSEEYAQQMITYIAECLEDTNEVELWDIWLGGAWLGRDEEARPNMKSSRTRDEEDWDTWDEWKLHKVYQTKATLSQLDQELLNEFFNGDHTHQKCLVIRK